MAKPDFIVHTPAELQGIRRAANAAALALDRVCSIARPGMTTKELDEEAGAIIRALGGKSAFLGYRGYPANICISVNDEVVHGIGRPDRFLLKGDVVSIDLGVEMEGGVGDNARTVYLGDDPPERVALLLDQTKAALMAGIAAAKAGNYICDISAAIEAVAKRSNFGVVREYVGHGCGTKMHEPPEVPNFTSRHRGPRLVPGMVLAIEPMFNLGTYKVFMESDNWTVRTCDAKVSAHFEHMALILENQTEVLTCLKM
jgi:methionyl aminopeptidase